MTENLVKGLHQAAEDAGIPIRINSIGSMFTVFFSDAEITDLSSAKTCNTERYSRFFHAMLQEGVYFPPSQFETSFVSLAHTMNDIQATIQAAHAAFKTVAKKK